MLRALLASHRWRVHEYDAKKEEKSMNSKVIRALSSTAVLIAIAFSTMFLPAVASAADDDPPGRVARIRYLEGSVSFQPAGESDWVSAVTNRPMTTGDQLWADAGSRAEVQIGSAMIRVAANTGFSFLNLDDRIAQIQLTDGTLNLTVQRLTRNEVIEVDTPNQAFSITQPGQYRVETGTDGNSSMVTVRQGQGEVTGGGRTYDLRSGQSGTFTGTDTLDGYVSVARDQDDFDKWGQSRDRQYDGSQSARYVSHDVVGYEDLDNNGTWRSDPTYGNVWTPTSVQSGWAPYHNGHWVWIAPWGWTWVDDAPWGYAPFHYGRWVSIRGNWGWVPGPMNSQPVYAPALVAFIGGANFGVSVSVGGGGYGGGDVGWFPLGPREVYVPGYNTSRGYVDRVNTSNTNVNNTTITNVYNNQVTNNNRTNVIYVNRTVQGAVTAVPQNAFRSSTPVARAAVPVNEHQIAAAPVVSRAAVAPSRDSVLGVSAPTANRVARPPAAVVNRPVVAKATPPPPPVPFARQQQELAKHPGQPLATHEVQVLRPANVAVAQPQVKQAPPGKPATLKTGPPVNQPVLGSARQPGNAQPPVVPGNKAANLPVANAPANKPATEPVANVPPNKQSGRPVATAPADTNQPIHTDRPPSAQQQQADKAREQQAAQQQAAQQQAAAKQQADKAREQQAAQQQVVQQQAAAKQQADKAREQQATQQQVVQQQAAAKQQADKAREQQATQQQVVQQQAAAKRQADKAREQQAAQQQVVQQQAAAKQQADKAREQQAAQQQAAQQQAEKARGQQAAQAQQADKAREQQAAPQAVQQRPDRPPNAQPAPQPKVQPANQPQAHPAPPLTPAEKARQEQQKKDEKPPSPQ